MTTPLIASQLDGDIPPQKLRRETYRRRRIRRRGRNTSRGQIEDQNPAFKPENEEESMDESPPDVPSSVGASTSGSSSSNEDSGSSDDSSLSPLMPIPLLQQNDHATTFTKEYKTFILFYFVHYLSKTLSFLFLSLCPLAKDTRFENLVVTWIRPRSCNFFSDHYALQTTNLCPSSTLHE